MNESAIVPTKDRPDDVPDPAKPIQNRANPMRFTYKSGTSPLAGYTIKRGIGAGGFGEVYYATTESGKEVALKHIQRNLEIEMRGAKHCLNLKHPHLVSLFDIRYDDEGEGWIVMEFVNGDSLQDVIEKYPQGMPIDLTFSWFRAIASAVGYLHDHGIVHRDLKPGNIFEDTGTVKIGDYGLSKFISVSRRSGQTESVGTFHYMAPEIGKGIYGREIDVYALGVILHEMLTGRVPFEGESSQEIIMKHLTATPDLGAVDPRFRPAIANALEKDPEKRTSSAEEMLSHLGIVPASGPVMLGDSVPLPASNNSGASPNAGTHPQEPFVPSVAVAPELSQPADEEPIAKAVHNASESVRRWWNDDRIGMPMKVIVVTLVGFGVATNLQFLIPLGIVGAACYCAYLMIRLIYKSFQDSESNALADRKSDGYDQKYHPQAMKRKHRAKSDSKWKPKREDRERNSLRLRSPHEHARQLIGSLLASGILSVVVSAILVLFLGLPENLNTARGLMVAGPIFLFLTGITTAASWAILVASKCWESERGDSTQRRIIMLVTGVLLGALCWVAGSALLGDMASADIGNFWKTKLLANSLGSLALYFGILFLLPKWWRQADPLRKTRLSLWDTGWYVLMAFVVSIFWPMTQPWSIFLIGAISLTVQLSAPWISKSKRDELRRQYESLEETTIG